MKKTAILLGATGATGSQLLQLLLEDPRYSEVRIFTRSPVGISHPKLQEYQVDLLALENEKAAFQGDDLFCCIGTTAAKTPKKNEYRKIDYGIPLTAARLAKENGVRTCIVMSAMGADSNSRVFYNKTKGEMERDVLAVKIPSTYIVQPSLIAADRTESRPGEKAAKLLMRVFKFLIPKKYRAIRPDTIAKAMIYLANHGHTTPKVANATLKELAQDA